MTQDYLLSYVYRTFIINPQVNVYDQDPANEMKHVICVLEL